MLDYKDFRARWAPTLEGICRDIFRENRASISVKKEGVAVRNMVRILEAVFALSREKGFQTMTLRDLSSRSGLSMGALYSYFSGKEELRALIQRQGVSYAKRIILEQIDGIEHAADRLEVAVEAHLYLSEILRPWFYFAYMEASSLSPREKRKAMDDELSTERIFHDILQAGSEAGVFHSADPALAAALIKAVLQDWYLKRWKYKRRGVTVEAYARFVVGFVLTSLTNRGGRVPA